ncbi:MAG TPA: hypothetical protein VIT91_13990 [Chthoniobacterales bacterium]
MRVSDEGTDWSMEIASIVFRNMDQPARYSRRGYTPVKASCYSIAIFTKRWREIRALYVEVLGGRVVSERIDRYSDLVLGGVPITLRVCEHGEQVSYFHLYLSIKERKSVLDQLRRNGVIVLIDGPYATFRDPEGRLIKLSESAAVLFSRVAKPRRREPPIGETLDDEGPEPVAEKEI